MRKTFSKILENISQRVVSILEETLKTFVEVLEKVSSRDENIGRCLNICGKKS
jgi:hypothetical protein